MEYYRPYKTLREEGRMDIDFFEAQMIHFKGKLALRAFEDVRGSETMNDIVKSLKTLIKVCEIHQRHLERMEQIEYKAYIAQLLRDIGTSQKQEEQTGVGDRQPTIIKRKVTWFAEG